ncbi:MAG: sulfite exporter TauE/SafE family protein [Cypionkella sp.]|uniref:sulfite exporter TauE/SafE family protein n=2 Tax=Cypionkella sp. TaxID=2811411 RepID=UPI0026016BE3|nr:sulfite exporter TauE/SafE family protein [Cypionkella sp.]MDB5660694.1 sulfite exporter TauE/SafE family protein [Cypionkella sp.]
MPEISALLPMVALLVVIGAFAGVVAGLLGVGGGIVLVPAFFYAFNHLGYGGPQLMQICVATSLATIVVTSPRSVASHHKKGAVDWQMLRDWAPFIVGGALAGTLVAALVKSVVLQVVFGVLAGLAGLYMAFGKPGWRLGETLQGQPARAMMASVLAFCSAMMGIGGGTFGVPLMSLYGVPIHRAVATAAGLGVLIAVPSVLGFLFVPIENAPPYTLGAVNLPAFLVVIGSTMLTTPWGVKLAHAMNPKPLKRAFAVFIILVALNMLRKVSGW